MGNAYSIQSLTGIQVNKNEPVAATEKVEIHENALVLGEFRQTGCVSCSMRHETCHPLVGVTRTSHKACNKCRHQVTRRALVRPNLKSHLLLGRVFLERNNNGFIISRYKEKK